MSKEATLLSGKHRSAGKFGKRSTDSTAGHAIYCWPCLTLLFVFSLYNYPLEIKYAVWSKCFSSEFTCHCWITHRIYIKTLCEDMCGTSSPNANTGRQKTILSAELGCFVTIIKFYGLKLILYVFHNTPSACCKSKYDHLNIVGIFVWTETEVVQYASWRRHLMTDITVINTYKMAQCYSTVCLIILYTQLLC